MNILLTSAGRRVSLLRAFQRALKSLDIEGQVAAVDLSSDAPALQVADIAATICRVTDPDYIDQLLALCIKHKISLVVPTIDTELALLARSREQFHQQGITLLISSVETNRITFDKRDTYTFFMEQGIPAPKQYTVDEALELLSEDYPLLVKPANGSSSVGVTVVQDKEELEFYGSRLNTPVVQEYLQGDEYTLDILVDFSAKVRSVVPRLRIETRAGEISKGVTVRDSELIEMGKRVVEALPGAQGCITLQCFRLPDGSIRFIEINPRFGGGFPLSANAGANFPRWILQMLLKMPEDKGMQTDWRDGHYMLRYDQEIFLSREAVEEMAQ